MDLTTQLQRAISKSQADASDEKRAKKLMPHRAKRSGQGAHIMSAEDYYEAEAKREAINIAHAWLETDDLDEDETYASRLESLVYGAVSTGSSETVTDDEHELMDDYFEFLGDYFMTLGASEPDIEKGLSDFDEEALLNIMSSAVEAIPNGDEDDHIDDYVFDSGELDATYKKIAVYRQGKKIIKRKRVAGAKIIRTPKQKMALKRAQKRSQRGEAKVRRARTNRVRKAAGR